MRKARRQVTINSRSFTASCGRCNALMLPNATVCRSCGGFAVDFNRRVNYDVPVVSDRTVVEATVLPSLEEALPAYARPNPERISTILACWPFGAADAADAPTYDDAPAEPTAPKPYLELVAHRSDVPTQRREMESVPSVGPNPFLAAARLEQARIESNAV